MIASIKRLKGPVTVIAMALIAAFIAYDIAWAYPDEGGSSLAVPGMQNRDVIARVRVGLIIDLIERRGTLTGLAIMKLDDILVWQKSGLSEFDGVEFDVIKHKKKVIEVRLRFNDQREIFLIRYFDPESGKALPVPVGYDDVTEALSHSNPIGTVSHIYRQVLRKRIVVPAPKKPAKPVVVINERPVSRSGPSLGPGMWTMLKQIVAENPSIAPQGWDAIDKLFDDKFDEFMRQDFRGDGLKTAMGYYSEFESFYRGVRDVAGSKKSRILKPKDESAEDLLDRLDDFDRYVRTKLSWIFILDRYWSEIQGAREERNGLKTESAAELLLKRNSLFMAMQPFARLLEEDEQVFRALKVVIAIAEGKPVPPAAIEPVKERPEKPLQIAVKKPAGATKEVTPPSAPAKEKTPPVSSFIGYLKNVNWKYMAITSAAAIPLAFLLSLVLPVNIFTVSIALMLPIVCFFLFSWSWQGLIFTILASVALSVFLPIPWFGLSLTAILMGHMIVHKGAALRRGTAAGKGTAGAPQQAPAVAKKEESQAASAKKTEPRDANDPLSGVTIESDVLDRIIQVIRAMWGETADAAVKREERAKRLSDYAIMNALFASGHLKDVPEYRDLKEELRPLVARELEKIEKGYSFDFKNVLEKLKNWRHEKDKDLAHALSEVAQEVATGLKPTDTESTRTGEMLAIQELIAERCGIGEKRFELILRHLIVARIRETVRSNEMIGAASGDDYHMLGILEFNVKNYAGAEAAFERAVEKEPFRQEFVFTLGVVKHLLQDWDEAKKYYGDFIRINKATERHAPEDEARIKLTELLIKKTDKRIPLIKGRLPEGNLIGKVYIDKEATQQVLSGVNAAERNGFVEFCGPAGDILYTKEGKEARVKLAGEVVPVESGHALKIMEDNEHIRGFADTQNVYIARSLSKNPIAIYHEFKESYYASHPEQLPQGVNAHTFLRGCGTDIRELLSHRKISGLGAEELVEYIKKLLPPERYNENEFNLIKYNGTIGKKGKELTYGDQDRQFGVEANREFSKTIREKAPAASRRTFRSYEEIMFRDYFEDIFEKNIELFVLLSYRMMAEGAELDSALKRQDELKAELLSLTEKYPYYMFREDGGFRNTVAYINNRIERAIELINKKDEPAAHWCLTGVVNRIRDARMDLFEKWLERKRRYQKKLVRQGRVVRLSQSRYRVHDGGKRPIVDHADIEFETLWEAMRSVWEQIDSEIDERRDVRRWADSLDNLREMMHSSDFKLSQDQIAAISRAISDITAGMVKPGGELKVEEKRIAKLFLEASVKMLSLGDRHIRTVAIFMEKAEALLRARLDNTESIINSLHEVRLGAVMLEADRRDKDLIERAEDVISLLDAGRYDEAKGNMFGITRLNDLKGEPEYKGLHDIVWPAITRPELIKQAAPYMRLIIRKCSEALFLRYMLRKYWSELVRRELSSSRPVDREAFIEEVFAKIADDNAALQAMTRGRARWWAKFYQAVNIPLKVDGPKGRDGRVSNPVFEAASVYIFILGFGHLADALRKERVITKGLVETKAYIEGILSQRKHLIREDLPGLADALAKDYGLDDAQAAQLKSCVRVEKRSTEEAEMVKLAQERAAARLAPGPAKAPKADASSPHAMMLGFNGMRIMDDKNERFRLEMLSEEKGRYPLSLQIVRESDGILIGSVQFEITKDRTRNIWVLELGLANIYGNVKGVNYQGRGLFTRVLRLMTDAMPDGSELNIPSLEETETLKALARGVSWTKTKMGKIFYGNGWKPQLIAIHDLDKSGTYVLYDRKGQWPEFCDEPKFLETLEKAIADIDKTDRPEGANINVVLYKPCEDGAPLIARSVEMPKDDKVLAAQLARAPPFIKGIHELLMSSGRPAFATGSKILISENLLSPEDALALRSVLGKNIVEILPAEAIRNAAMNGAVSRDKLGCIVTREEFNSLWNGSHRTNNKSTVLVLDEDLKDTRYLYIEGVIGLALAMMNGDTGRVRGYASLLFSTLIDDQVLELLKRDNPIEFAIRAILRFKPVEPMKTGELQQYKKTVEAALAAA
ncbi:MAG: hypothetical protein JW919_04160 [Candidatus Omnitrophica bacterium]|nr:hypothetical protein [Candidatus Omnitrophota bacterium]